MKFNSCLIFFIIFFSFGYSQTQTVFSAGFTTKILVDSSRIYKQNTTAKDSLHFRPVELDIWYPASRRAFKKILFKSI